MKLEFDMAVTDSKRDAILRAARDEGLRVTHQTATRFTVEGNEAMDAYKLGRRSKDYINALPKP